MRSLPWLRSPLVLAAAAFAALGLLSLLPETSARAAGVSLLRLAFALIGILALALGAVPLLRRLPTARGAQSRRLRCEELLALDSRHRIALLSVDGRELLVSLQADGSRLLVDLGAAAGQSSAGESAASASAAAGEFQRLLAERRGR
jgi:flagellar biogenesis protein FliO